MLLCIVFYTNHIITCVGDCTTDSDCGSDGSFCQKICPTDTYGDHKSLLAAEVSLTGNSYVSVSPNRYPSFTQNLAIVAKFSQSVGNDGYLLFYGTGNKRNLGIYLNSDSTMTQLSLYYTDVTGGLRSRHIRITPSLADGMTHCLVLNIYQSEFAVYADGNYISSRNFTGDAPDFTYGVS